MSNFTVEHPADIAEYLESLPPKERNLSFWRLAGHQKTEVFICFDSAMQHEILESLGDKGMRELIANLA
ncbi:MAG TPA: hypothetical protein VK106_05535, partial [Balneolaceae bacterium]|nr:hypothetical protein [Balneolaceae bacterium]